MIHCEAEKHKKTRILSLLRILNYSAPVRVVYFLYSLGS
nr:MAG TPA: protein of unknown function (DUF3458) [Caudoviricetes sp.]